MANSNFQLDKILSNDEVLFVISDPNGNGQININNADQGKNNICNCPPAQKHPEYSSNRVQPQLLRKPFSLLSIRDSEKDIISFVNPWEKIKQNQRSLDFKESLFKSLTSSKFDKCDCSDKKSKIADWHNIYGPKKRKAKAPCDSEIDVLKCMHSCKKAHCTVAFKNPYATNIKQAVKKDYAHAKNKCAHRSRSAARSDHLTGKYMQFLADMFKKYKSLGLDKPSPSKTRQRRRSCRSRSPSPNCRRHYSPIKYHPNRGSNEQPSETVPRHMGWNWHRNQQERKCPAWRPGAIPRSIRELMTHFLSPDRCDTVPITKRCRAPRPADSRHHQPLPNDSTSASCPMIEVHRTAGDEYTVTMRPLKTGAQLRREAGAAPYMDCEPVRIRVSGNRDRQLLSRCRAALVRMGVRPCRCGHVAAECTCRNTSELRLMCAALRDCELRFGVCGLAQRLSLRATRPQKEFVAEFTPPAAVQQRQPDRVQTETQYEPKDFKVRRIRGLGGPGGGEEEGDWSDGEGENGGGDGGDGDGGVGGSGEKGDGANGKGGKRGKRGKRGKGGRGGKGSRGGDGDG